jgi:hypothetical protein
MQAPLGLVALVSHTEPPAQNVSSGYDLTEESLDFNHWSLNLWAKFPDALG